MRAEDTLPPGDAFARAAATLTEESLRLRGGKKWEDAVDGMLPAWVAESDFAVAPVVRAALTDVVDRGEFGYVSDERLAAFRGAVSRWYGEAHATPVPEEHVHPVGDVIEAYRHAIRDFTAPGTPIIVPLPAYPPFSAVAAEEGRDVLHIGAVGGLDLDALDATMREHRALLVLCNPHNPLGRVAPREELLAIAEIVDRSGGRVFADEIHAPLVLDDVSHVPYASVSPAAAAHSLTAFAASKAFNLPSLKAAALLTSNAADLGRWNKLGPLAGHGAGIMGLVAGTAALDHGREWLTQQNAYLRSNRDLVGRAASGIPGAAFTLSQATYLQWIDLTAVDRTSPIRTAAHMCAEAGLLVNDGSTFGGFPGHIRLNFATPRHLLVEMLDRLTRAFA
ncbi:aminotransferase class I/II-fold pyridoxal phosphate-dependent enzyme [Microbacterium sp. P26]|uniref:MalY/PatB family protein n=1 Tax=Microbacterium TaxID=33882 RepID=UPI00203DB655|nr:aminotransferase class I/II-fold pyridoxal phosphate-dependent enzyme [Microbacterium sp. P26]MCM3501165.1 aminotransferase class I/II-fold pyridoxal phosphate-dependent enzyme [Microbacterium sp. P26]